MARRTPEERDRRRFTRRQWARRWRVWRLVAVGLVLVLLVGGAGYTVYFSEALAVTGAEVTGTEDADSVTGLDRAEVLEVARVPIGEPLATADLVAIERRVAALAEVRSVQVTRRWPHDVLIQVEPREPVAVVDRAGDLRAVDIDGVVFGRYQRPPADLPRIVLDASTVSDVDALREAASVVGQLPDDVSAVVDHLELRSVDDIDLALRDQRLVRWGGAEGTLEKAEVLRALLGRRGEVYDVSVPGSPTIS